MVMGPTHATSGAVAWLAGAGAVTTLMGYQQAPAELAVYTAVCAGAALLPDLDVRGQVFRRRGGATAARVFGVPSLMLAAAVERLSLAVYVLTRTRADPHRRNGHRTLTHTLAFAALLGAGLTWLVGQFGKPVVLGVLFFTLALAIRGLMGEWIREKGWIVTTTVSVAVTVLAFAGLPADGYPLLGVAVGVGCVVHVLGDMITHQGCPALWPIPIRWQTWFPLTTPRVVSVRAGGKVEKAVLLPGLTVATCAAVVWQVPEVPELVSSLTTTIRGPSVPEAGGG